MSGRDAKGVRRTLSESYFARTILGSLALTALTGVVIQFVVDTGGMVAQIVGWSWVLIALCAAWKLVMWEPEVSNA